MPYPEPHLDASLPGMGAAMLSIPKHCRGSSEGSYRPCRPPTPGGARWKALAADPTLTLGSQGTVPIAWLGHTHFISAQWILGHVGL